MRSAIVTLIKNVSGFQQLAQHRKRLLCQHQPGHNHKRQLQPRHGHKANSSTTTSSSFLGCPPGTWPATRQQRCSAGRCHAWQCHSLDLQGSFFRHHTLSQRKHVCPDCWTAVDLLTNLQHPRCRHGERVCQRFAVCQLASVLNGAPLAPTALATCPASLASCSGTNYSKRRVPLLQACLEVGR